MFYVKKERGDFSFGDHIVFIAKKRADVIYMTEELDQMEDKTQKNVSFWG